MRTLFLITVDCDLRCEDIGLRQKSLEALLQAFEETGVTGHITWFANENDFQLTRNHGSFLQEVLRREDSLGIHDHFESFKGVYEREAIRKFCRRSKEAMERWLEENGRPMRIRLHRNGCLVQHPEVYIALKDLGYTVVSEVWPGRKGKDRDGYPAFDNRSVPIGILPYRHDEMNFSDWNSQKGHFIQVPVTHMFLKKLDYSLMERWIQAFKEKSIDPGILLWLFHPYEILDESRQRISREAVELLKSHIERCRAKYRVEFATVEEALSHAGYLS